MLHSCIFIECTATPTPPRNVTVQPSQTSLLIEWIEPEQVYGEFDAYYVVCGTQTAYTYSITETAANVTGLSVFTRYECCVTVYVYYSIVYSTPNCVNATTAPGICFSVLSLYLNTGTYMQISLLSHWLSTSLSSRPGQFNWSGPDHNPSMASSPTTPLRACKLMDLL